MSRQPARCSVMPRLFGPSRLGRSTGNAKFLDGQMPERFTSRRLVENLSQPGVTPQARPTKVSMLGRSGWSAAPVLPGPKVMAFLVHLPNPGAERQLKLTTKGRDTMG
jgi:hypothetical protein